MVLKSGLPFLEWQSWLSWVLILLASPACAQMDRAASARRFTFTHNIYNGTVPENALGKVYIKTPVKMGIYLPNSLTVSVDFSIVEGDQNEIFHAERLLEEDFCFLRVRTKTGVYFRLNREQNEQYMLKIKASRSYIGGSFLEAYTYLNITVLDQNEFSPLFLSTPFNVSVPEDTPLHHSIAAVKASDADSGINGEIYYSLVVPSQMFAIHPTSGVISLMRPLHGQNKSYELDIHAEDRGFVSPDRDSSPLSNTKLKINVIPVNYNAPSVLVQRHQTLVENANQGTIFAVLTITDEDEGINGKIGDVSIVNDSHLFRVVSATEKDVFNIVVASELDREIIPDGFTLFIQAADRGQPPRTSTVAIPVRIQDINDNEPKFEKGVYEVELLEAMPVHTPILFVKATDKDQGNNAEVRYKILDSDGAKFFSIDEGTGMISIAAELDTETQKFIVLKVQAEDSANSATRKSSQTKVTITVNDFNDNAPKFANLDSTAYVSENMPKGTVVTTITATDIDSGENGYISYSITNTHSVPFDIDPFSGAITTTEVLDFETMRKTYSLLIRASDWGSPFRQESETLLTVRVQDANDNSPEFEKTRCKGYLSREAVLGTEIVVLTAIDFDSGNIISYRISDGNDDGCFTVVPSTGSVQLACDLTTNSDSTRTLTVVASDGLHISVPATVVLNLVNNKRSTYQSAVEVRCQTTDVTQRLQAQLQISKDNNRGGSGVDTVTLLPQSFVQNLHSPVFENSFPVYISSVSEETSVGSVLLTVSASDDDEGCNGQVVYVITDGNIGGAFKMDTFTGELKVLSPLDYETNNEYNLTITAQDLGSPRKFTSKVLNVFVGDDNDNSPLFHRLDYEQSISEDVQVNHTVLQVSASDKDTGLNALIHYSILSNGEDFFVEPESGIIKVKRNLDRERQSRYKLLIQAEDSGPKRRLSSTTTVDITLIDVNDNFPEFFPKLQTVRVREDLPVGTVITILTAHDIDEGDNAKVTYKLIDGADMKFEVDTLTGAVRILNELDFETTQVYNLSVRAEDLGQHSLASMCLLNVEIVDINENHHAPEFDKFFVVGSVAENSPVGTYVITVRAQDGDSASSKGGRISYSIREGSGLGRFTIDSNGTIRTSQVFDRETSSHFWLTVYAQDGGLVPQFAYLEVLVRIEDVNDNVPQSVDPAYYGSIQENIRNVQSIITIQANDGDRNPNQALNFAITGGNPQNFFSIDPVHGIISTTNRSLDREKQEEHALEVTIYDNGNPPLSSSTRVVIKVTDENDNKPKFVDQAGHIAVFAEERGQLDIFVYRTVAYDADEGPNAEITYSLRSQQEQFYINNKTGEIFSRKSLVANASIEFTIRATDNGPDRQRASQVFRINVLARPTFSTNPPYFKDVGLKEKILGSERPGQLIVLLSAEDPDEDDLVYAIEGGNEDKMFAVHPTDGKILLAHSLDWEIKSYYNLSVSVTDGVHKNFTWVYIEVLDVNNNEPVFSHQLYKTTIPESSKPGQHVLRITATDRDKDDRLLYSLASAASTTSLSKFKIGANNGVIVVDEALDREEMSRHLLTVMVRDQSVPSKKGFSRVEIDILDDNDHKPRFLSENFEGRVFETAAIGTLVVEVFAVDQDKGSNSELSYSILSGNADNTFSIDSRLGFISVAKQLDRHVQPDFHMVVMATDHGQPAQSSTAAVHISVTVSNNAPPKFDRQEMATELQENLPVGTVVDAVHAESQSTVVYSITEGNENGCFFINPNSGVISTLRVIDFEVNQFYNLTIMAANIIGATSTAHMLIHIGDKNDNHPVFRAECFYGNISEAAEPGSMVLDAKGLPLVIQAMDADSGQNSQLQYEILDVEVRRYFSVDVNTGAIQTRLSLDHETTASFNFTVQVRDQGTPQLYSQTPARVVIFVADINDVPPRFTENNYQAKVLLPTYCDVTVLQVNAIDPDTVNTKALTFSIVGGNQGGIFAINPQSGQLHVKLTQGILDRYELKIQVSDGTFDVSTSVIITVEQSRDSGLRFTKDTYTVNVTENDSRVQNLIVVQPIVPDLNHKFSFSLLNNNDMFTVGATSGVVQTRGVPFDREQNDAYTVVVQVVDSYPEPRTAHVVMTVNIMDVNDNVPMFVKQPFQTIVSTGAQHGEVIKKVTATDADLGENGEVRYFLPADLTNNNLAAFGLNQYTGDIVVRELTEDDKDKHYLLTVIAVDRGLPSLSAEVQVPVYVVDSSSPMFKEQQLHVSIPENTPMYAPVISIQAISPKGEKLIYSISNGDRYGDFAVDFNTGLISVVGQLDYESMKQYNLVIRASDVNSASYAETSVNITLEDVNDNAPTFESVRYTHTVSEMARIGTSILQVSAHDADSAANSLLHYSLAPVSPNNHDAQPFFINSESGIITLQRQLDHEKQKEFTFLAVATDSGMPAKSSTAIVLVIVIDVNDNAPHFSQPSFNCYITDQVLRGQLVTKVMASDEDESDRGRLSYAIMGGNEKQAFSIDFSSGVITVAEHRKPEFSPSYILNVSVSDGVYTSFARVAVGVRNTNQHVPRFTQDVYLVEIPEMQPVGTSVIMLSALDSDRGNYGMLTYTIPSEYMSEIFSIDTDTGEIITRQVLDRELTSEYEFTVAATDNGGQMGFAVVKVSVLDVNDNMPMFLMKEYRSNIRFDASVSSKILQVKAVDADFGPNGQIHYFLHAGEDSSVNQLFAVDIETGILSVQSSVTFAVNKVFQFFVRARDQGIPAQENHVPVEILILDSDDVPPRFPSNQRSFFIQEDEEPGSIVATVTAQSLMPLNYRIIPGMTNASNVHHIFSINDFGEILLMRPLSREIIPVYSLAVRAQTLASPPLVAHIDVQIQLRDINNNPPQFESIPYTATIVENADIGTSIIQVKAIDKDVPRYLTYSFGEGMKELANIFTVDSKTGWIQLLTKLDRETKDEYNLTIIVIDTDDDTRINGEVVRLTSSTNVVIAVTDCNDNAPVFDKPAFSTAVNEGALLGTALLTLTATDADVGLNADITYYIVGGDPLGQFQIHSTGDLFVNKPLDRESRSQYQLNIAATDGGFVTYSTVTVTILDDNDNAPICDETFLEVIENEDIAAGKPIAQIKATDGDERSTINARIQFTLDGSGAEKFLLVKESGVLRTAVALDRETQQEYTLMATGTDGGGFSCTTEIRIFLRDVNDNPPQFTENFQDTLTIQEDARINTLLTRVTTVDRDAGINRNTLYKLGDAGPRAFSIDPKSGILRLVSTLDREQNPEYNVSVIAYNEISPELSATATLRIVVLDVNDNPPNFERTSYYTSVSEAAEVGTVVVRVRATSLDIGPNAAITYSIAAGNQQGKFTIGSVDGIVRISEPLDHELSREYFLTILARDQGSPPLSNTAIISINITDVNDNPPRFGQDAYTASVSELAAEGTEVFKVMASDADGIANSVITYSIIDGNPDGNFLIGLRDGVIQIATPVDRELIEHFTLVIQARDSGQPFLYSTAIVTIIVEDANDNAPQFQSSNFTSKVQEGRRTGIEIMRFSVTDMDTPVNGAPFSFDIIAGNSDGEFLVDSNGVLTTAGKLSKMVKDTYELTIRVFDSGNPSLHSDTRVSIHVVDDSLWPPEVRNLSIHITSCMDSFPGGVIGYMEARDRDLYDTLTYNIMSPNRHLFDIHRTDGRLIALTGLDDGEYIVNISVTDQKFTRYGQVLVTVVCLTRDVIDNAITIQFENMIPEQFYASYKKDFQFIVKQALSVRLNDVEIINVQPSAETIYASNRNRPRRSSPENDLDVLFAVRRAVDRFFNRKSLKRKVQKFTSEIESRLGVRVLRLFSDVCTRTTCESGTCVGSVVFDNSKLIPVVINGESFVSARHYYTHQCLCMEETCLDPVCGEKPCQIYEVCGMDVFGEPVCQCPEGRNGPQCQNVIPLCSGSMCPIERPMTFSGKSYAKWTLGQPTQKRMSLSLRIRTRQSSAILMYAKGQVDYSILEIEDGNLVYRFNCGSGEGQVLVPVDLSDGQWHRIVVERSGRHAEINLDDAYTAMGQAPGVHDSLNLYEEEVFFGARVDIHRNGYRDITKGFEGCMEDIRMFNVPLPFTGSNSIARSQEFEIVEFHCKDSSPKFIPVISNACSSSPCLNGGSCQFSGLNSYICVCRGRFKGPKCEIDSDPCQDQPCLNQGQCKMDAEAPNMFTCQCRGELSGMRCTYGHNCRPNPCKHGSTCIEGPTSALCHCAPGFAGLYCEKTVDVCASNPCQNGATCHPIAGGSFLCNCTDQYMGHICEEIDFSKSPSNSSIISDHLYVIIGAVAGVLVLIVISTAWCIRHRQRKNRRSRANVTNGIAEGENEVLLNSVKETVDFKRKVSNPDLSVPIPNIPSQPPPVPNRPVSYTPSTHASLNTLNNLDSVGNYGSAADELEITGLRHHIPDFNEYLQSVSSFPSHHARNSFSSCIPPASDTESIQKAPWEFEYPNILGNYDAADDKKHRDKMAKHMPGLNSPTLNSRPLGRQAACIGPETSSVSSLAVSESEDDLNARRAKRKGYHWDTSDWAPRPSLPNISEIPANEVPDSSPSSSPPTSYDSNNRVPSSIIPTTTADTTPDGVNPMPDPDYVEDSEYVGDSEYAENEYDFDDRDDLPPRYADLPSYEQLLSLRDMNDSYELPPNLNVHPDHYLPSYNYQPQFDQDSILDGAQTEEDNGNVSDEQNADADAANLSRNGATLRHLPGRVYLSPGYVTSGDYTTDVEPPSRTSFIDDMSMSVGGYTSNASCSDISGLCEIEDSEVNASEDDSGDDEHSPCLSYLHTQV